MRDFMLELNRKYIDMFCELAQSGEQIPTKQYGIMLDILFKQYLDELDIKEKEYKVANSQSIFELNYKHAVYVPRRRGLFRHWNRIARLLLKKYDSNYEKVLIDMDKVVTASQIATTKAMKKLLKAKSKLKQAKDMLAKDKENKKKSKRKTTKASTKQNSTALVVKQSTEIVPEETKLRSSDKPAQL